MAVTADEEKIIERARLWDETRRAKNVAEGDGSSPRKVARAVSAHWRAGNDLSEAIEKAPAPP